MKVVNRLTVWNSHELSFLFKAPAASATNVWIGLQLLTSFTSGTSGIQKSVIFPTLCMPLLDSKVWFNYISNSSVTRKQALSIAANFCEWTDFFNYTVIWLNNHPRQSDFQSKQMVLWLNLLTQLGMLLCS